MQVAPFELTEPAHGLSSTLTHRDSGLHACGLEFGKKLFLALIFVWDGSLDVVLEVATLFQVPADENRRERWQSSLFSRFSNISSIDVTRLMETLLQGFSQISAALRLMALLAGMAGMAAVFSVLRLRAGERRPELQLLKLLGAPPAALTRALTLEAAVLAGAAGTFGVVLSLVVGAALSVTVFESPPAVPPLRLLFGVPLVFTVLGGWLGRLSARDVLATRPQEWLRSIQEDS